jgi:hypothetical protein
MGAKILTAKKTRRIKNGFHGEMFHVENIKPTKETNAKNLYIR